MNEVNDVINELSSIIRAMKDIEFDLRNKFTGIYTEICADKLSEKIQSLEIAHRELQKIGQTQVNE